ncbi:MAG TPA: DNA double-strand break repair nuclease NurA [Pyrinomonadaceae bacterium]
MLYRHLLDDALRERREEFMRFERSWRADVLDYVRRLRGLEGQTALEIEALAGHGRGALPSPELERAGSIVIPFGKGWRTHEEARRWAIDALQERVTFAADGSQLLPGREISMPVAAVQVAWFENPHTRDGKYHKQARCSILSPKELLEGADDRINANTIVDFHRFKLETEEAAAFLKRKSGWQTRGERTPVAFFDGTLLISIALPKTRIQDAYVRALVELVRLSRETEVPLVGYVDQSYARDLVRLLDSLPREANQPGDGANDNSLSNNNSLYDAQLLHASLEGEAPLLEAWGDRTSFCYSRREGFEDEGGQPLVGFTYLQTTSEGAPARLDVPVWIYEAGLLDDVVDAVRAECVTGLGYPYVIEAADQAACIGMQDRAHFLHAIQDFAEKENLGFRLSRKAASKVRRR